MFVDSAKFEIRSGKGGAGSKSFRREKFVELGGPDGGDGGDGGSVYFECSLNTHTLENYKGKRLLKAQNGFDGSGRKKHGKNGEDLVLIVPPGTAVIDDESGEILLDLTKDKERKILLKGGKGGLGNFHFKNSVNQAPSYAQPGLEGQSKLIRLELKLIADVGLVGFPNVGKSTLISCISNARPQIANYEFTTLTPKLGQVSVDEFSGFVMADIPGIIRGASSGKGLGIEFLKHIERTKILLFMLDLAREDLSIAEQFNALRNEISAFSPVLAAKKYAIALTRLDACDINVVISNFTKFCGPFKQKLKEQKNKLFLKGDFLIPENNAPHFIIAISSATGENINELKFALWQMLQNAKDSKN